MGVLFGMAASRSIHTNMIKNVMAAPLGYFGTEFFYKLKNNMIIIIRTIFTNILV